jgi:tetratricopeptide (TPR) repeat protein
LVASLPALLLQTDAALAASTVLPLPELRAGVGSPPKPTDAMLMVGRALMAMRGDSLDEAGRMALDSAIVLYPNDPDARFLRATFTYCGMRHDGLTAALADLDSALARWGPTATPLGTSLPTACALKAQVELALGHDREGLALIEKAIRLNPDDAEDVFDSGTTDPDSATVACNWTRAKLDRLVARNPSDYRAHLARGLYYGFFKRFNTASHPKALRDLLTARRLAPSSAMCAYFLGCEYQSGGKTISGRLFFGTSATARQSALREFTAAIALDPRFAPAYAQRAAMRSNAKQYTLAIKDYDAIIELEPNNAGALNDRGLAKKALGNFWGALHDFSEAARIKSADAAKAADDATLYSTFENQAACHAALGQFSEAADAMTEALRALLTSFAAAMSPPRLRDLFPECSDMDDETFLHAVHDAFCSTMPYATFESMKHDTLMAQLESTVIPTDYVQRGDYFLRAGNLRAALADYARARRAFPSSAGYTERWRLATANDAQEFYVDSQTEPADVARHTIWVKTLETKKGSAGWRIERITVDCGVGTLQVEASTTYGADGTVIASHEAVGTPTVIVPESIGEWFSKAICKKNTLIGETNR